MRKKSAKRVKFCGFWPPSLARFGHFWNLVVVFETRFFGVWRFFFGAICTYVIVKNGRQKNEGETPKMYHWLASYIVFTLKKCESSPLRGSGGVPPLRGGTTFVVGGWLYVCDAADKGSQTCQTVRADSLSLWRTEV